MSYILEALKKAQAERQLGGTPGIHTPTLDAPASTGAPLRKPLVAAVAVMGVVIVGLAAVVWRQAAAPAPAVQPPVAAVAPAPAVQPPVIAATPAQVAQPPVAAAVPAQPPRPPLPVQQAAPAPEPARPAQPVPAGPPAVAKAPEPPARVTGPVEAPAPARKSAEPAGEEPAQALRDLPEPIRRAVPPVAMSGYMYSPNPADRLILIDKVLRREGDEVAPGLVLERLEPKGAVFMFRGYRFRMPY